MNIAKLIGYYFCDLITKYNEFHLTGALSCFIACFTLMEQAIRLWDTLWRDTHSKNQGRSSGQKLVRNQGLSPGAMKNWVLPVITWVSLKENILPIWAWQLSHAWTPDLQTLWDHCYCYFKPFGIICYTTIVKYYSQIQPHRRQGGKS